MPAPAAARIGEADALLPGGRRLLPRSMPMPACPTQPHRIPAQRQPATGLVQATDKLGLSTSFELDIWGKKLRRASRATRAQALGTRYASETVSLSLAASVTQAYLNLRAIDAQLLAVRLGEQPGAVPS